MTWIIWQFLFLALPVVLPMTLYKRGHRFMARFHDAMARSVKARKLYAQLLLIVLLLFHYVYTGGHPGEFGVVLSTAVCAALFSFRRADRWLRGLTDRPRTFVCFALAAAVIGFVPHLYTAAVTVAFLLLAALFYPSTKVLSEREGGNGKPDSPVLPATSAGCRPENHHAKLPHEADNDNPIYPYNSQIDKSSKTESK